MRRSQSVEDVLDQVEEGSDAMSINADATIDRSDATTEKLPESQPSEMTERGRTDDAAEGSTAASTSDNEDGSDPADRPTKTKRRPNWSRIAVYWLLPTLVLSVAVVAGFFKWTDSNDRTADAARVDSVASAKDSVVALLSYQPDNVDKTLGGAAQDRLTGPFKDSYGELIREVVIPGSKEHNISAVATVSAAASASTTPTHAVVLLFVNQTVVVGTEPPSNSSSSVRVNMDKVGDRWLVSGFEPV